MAMRAAMVAVMAALVAPAALAAEAPAGTVSAADPASVARALQSAGYKGVLKINKSGKPFISSAANGNDFSIDLYNCKDNDKAIECKTLMFSTWWTPQPYITVALANDYNRTAMFGRAYLNDKNEMTLELPVTTVGGIGQSNFEALIDWFSRADGDLNALVDKARDAAKPKPAGDDRTIM